MRIDEVKGISADALKKKTLSLYKAYIFPKPDMEMKVNTSIEFLGISKEAAVKRLLQEIPLEVFTSRMEERFSELFTEQPADKDDDVIHQFGDMISLEYQEKNLYKASLTNAVIAFAILKLNLEDLKTKDLVDTGDDYFKDDVIAITLNDKLYKVDVSESSLISFDLTINPTNEERDISNIELKDIK